MEGQGAGSRQIRPLQGLSRFRFLLRYPILLLAFGPPELKEGVAGASGSHFDYWNLLQASWLAAISLRAIYRLLFSKSIRIPQQTRSILKYFAILGVLFLFSVAYSPVPAVSLQFLVLYILNLICVVEFLVDVYHNPPDWIQFLFAIRFIYLVLVVLVFVVLPFEPTWVMVTVEGHGIRLEGGQVASLDIICPVIAIISAYAFTFSLESKVKSVIFFLVAASALAATQVRGAEISLLLVLPILGIQWARRNVRFMSFFVSGALVIVLLSGLIAVALGDRVLDTFLRGQDIGQVLGGSGRVAVWQGLVEYCLAHPQGMGYIAGMRNAHLGGVFGASMHIQLNAVGGTDDGYMEVLADAGWLALAVYLIVFFKTAKLGWRFVRSNYITYRFHKTSTLHALQCALLVFLYCCLEQLENSDFAIPARQGFYIQYISIAIILGASGTLLTAARSAEAEEFRKWRQTTEQSFLNPVPGN